MLYFTRDLRLKTLVMPDMPEYYGAVGDGATDDLVAIQAAIDANPGNSIRLTSSSYLITNTINISTDGTRLVGDGPGRTWILNAHASADAIKFFSSSTATVTSFLNNCACENIGVRRSTDATAGAGIHLIQCNSFILDRVQVLNCPEGIKVAGGQLNKLSNYMILASSSILSTQTNALLRFKEAAIDGGLFQPCYTVESSDFSISGGGVISDTLLIESADGLNFVNGYIASADTNLLQVDVATTDEYIAGVHFTNVYFDGVSDATGTTNGVSIPANAVSGAVVYSVGFDNCFFGNFVGNALLCGEGVNQLSITNSKFVNITGWAIDFVGSNTLTDLMLSGNQVQNVGNTNSTGGFQISTVRSVIVTNNQFDAINNTSDIALSLIGTNVNGVVSGNTYRDCTANAVNGATWTGRISGIAFAWTPVITFATAGDLSVVYSSQVGRAIYENGIITVEVALQTSTFTHTTASGNLRITGLPITPVTTGDASRWSGGISFNGITKANYTNFAVQANAATSYLEIGASASAQGISTVAAADMPTGGTVILRGSVTYEVAL